MRGTLSGPTTAWDTKMDTRGTQTDLVTDRNIVDCLMELKSAAEFQDLTYRFNRSCTGEMTLIITRESSAGLLGVPFDPVSATITAGGFCYLSALFTPVEITDLRSSGSGSSVCLRKFRHILWKLNGRAGYGFCPGFREDHFPAGFRFKTHCLEVLRQPFTRIQSKGCPVFLQQRRTSSRASAQPLGIQLCSACFKALTDLYAKLKSSGEDLSSVPAFAAFLPANSHPVGTMLINSKFKKEVMEKPNQSSISKPEEEMPASEKFMPSNDVKVKEELLEKPSVNQLTLETQPEVDGEVSVIASEEGEHFTKDDPNLSVVSECDVANINPVEKTENDKTVPNMVPVKECSVLLDRFIPGVSCTSKESASSPRPETLSASQSPEYSPSTSSFHTSSQLSSSWPQMPPCSSTTAINNAKEQKSVSTKVDSSRPVLSARVKPFRATVPEGREDLDSNISESTDAAAGNNTLHRQQLERQGKADTAQDTGPPVLAPELDISPDNSPQSLHIDEDADPDELGSAAADEPEPKRPCYRCEFCQEGFQTEADLKLHSSQHHQRDPSISTTIFTSGNIPTTSTDCVTSDVADQPQQLTEQQKLPQMLAEHQSQQQMLEKGGPRLKVCPVCHSTYVNKEDFEAHMMERHRARLHSCRYCGEKFAMKRNLTDHLQRHRGAKKLICKDCGAKFLKKKEFASHVRQHMGSLPYFCTICSKFFSRESVYQEHVGRHRAKRGVRAVLSGDQKTLQGVLTKARRCLEEKAVMTPASTVSKATPSSTAQSAVTNSPSLPSSLSVPHSEPPPSNLYLLSAVSLARAELDRQPSDQGQKQPTSEKASVDLSKPNATAAAHLLNLSKGEQDKAILGDSQSPAALLEKKLHSAEDIQQTPVTESRPWIHDESTSSSMQSASDSSVKQGMGTSEQEQVLIDKEYKLRQKEQELEREQNILKKKMMMCQQLVLAQLSAQQQLKAHNGGTAVSTSDGQTDSMGDKKSSNRQVFLMLAALRKSLMSAKTTTNSNSAIRPPNSEPNGHGNAGSSSSLPGSVSGKMGSHFGSAIAPNSAHPLPSQTKSSSAEINPQRPLLPHSHASAAGATLFPATPSQNPLLHSPPRTPQPVAFMASQNLAQTTNHPLLPLPQQAQFQKSKSFLEDLMKLQPVMPAKVKEFLPKPAASKATTPIPTLTPTPTPSSISPSFTLGSLVSKPAAILCRKLPESPSKSAMDKGKGRSTRTRGGDRTTDPVQKKPGGWSGGQFKEKMNQVVTVVPPQEMSRLLSLTNSTPHSTLPTTSDSASPTTTASASAATPSTPSSSSALQAGRSKPPSPWLRSQQAPEVHPTHGSPVSQVTALNGAPCSSSLEISASPQPQAQTPHPSSSPVSQVPPSPQNSVPSHGYPPQKPASSRLSQPGSSTVQISSPPQPPNTPSSHNSSSLPSSSPRSHSQSPHIATAHQIPHGPPTASPASQIPPPPIHPSSVQASPQCLSSLQPPRVPHGSPPGVQAPAPVHDPSVHGPPLTSQPTPCHRQPLPTTLHTAGPCPMPGVPCSNDEVPQPAAEVQIVAEEVEPIDLTKGGSSRKHLTLEEGTDPVSLDPNLKSVVVRHVLLEPPAAHARQQILASESPVSVEKSASQLQIDFSSRQGINPQAAAALYAQIQATLQVSPDNPAAQALLRNFLPQLSRQSKGANPRFPMPPTTQVLPPGMPPLIRGNIPPPQQRARSSSPDRSHLLRSSTTIASVSAAPECVAPSSETSSAAGSSGPSPAVSAPSPSPNTLPVHSPSGTVTIATRSGSSSSLSSSSTASSSLQSGMSSPLYQQASTRYLLSPVPESSNSLKRFFHSAGARPEGERSRAAVNPLGGYAWHRPATVDPFVTPQKETSGSTALTKTADRPGGSEASNSGRKKRADIEELSDDQNLWQQQFLQTLREKRKQQQEQQERQQQLQQQVQQEQDRQRLQMDQTQSPQNTSVSKNAGKRRAPQRRRTRKKGASETGGANNPTSGSDLQGATTSQAAAFIQEVDVGMAAKEAAKPRNIGLRSRGKGKSRPRKTPTPPQLIGIEETPVSVPPMVIEEEGVEFDGNVSESGMKVEPLEAGFEMRPPRQDFDTMDII